MDYVNSVDRDTSCLDIVVLKINTTIEDAPYYKIPLIAFNAEKDIIWSSVIAPSKNFQAQKN